MSKIRFNLDRKVGDDEAWIMMIYHYDREKFKYSSREKIPISKWNDNRQRVKVSQDFPASRRINAKLEQMENTLNQILTDFHKQGIIADNQKLKNAMNFHFRGMVVSSGKIEDIITFLEMYINERSTMVAVATTKVYRTTLNKLKLWLGGKKLKFSELSNQHFKDFAEFLRAKNYQDNHVTKIVKTFSSFINAAVDDDRTSAEKNPFKSKLVGLTKPPSDNIFLTIEEINHFRNIDLSNNPRLERVRDAFIVVCYTGLRISDLRRLRKEYIEREAEGSIISMSPQKTGQQVEIPIKPLVMDILQKYNYDFSVIKPNKMNIALKEIGQLAHLDQPFLKKEYRRNKPEEFLFKKWEKLGTHTGRRSFVTNALLARMAPYEVMKVTGHKNLKSFEAYIKFNERENAKRLLGNDFFK